VKSRRGSLKQTKPKRPEIKSLYRIRQRRFRHAVNSMIKTIVEYVSGSGMSKIVLDLGVREDRHDSKVNATTNNFWSFDYTVKKLREKAEEYGIEVLEVSGYNTSQNTQNATQITRTGMRGYSSA